MTRNQRYALLLLRLALGWLLFYAGIVKLADPSWSAAGFLANAKTFPALFHWFASPGILPITNALNAWGLTLIGAALFFGVAVRLSAWLGVLMLALYYTAGTQFPYPDANSYLVDQHVIYAIGLLVLSVFHTGRIWGLGHFLSWFPFMQRFRHTLTR